MVNATKLKEFLSIDLYTQALHTNDSEQRRYIVQLLKERNENDLIYSLAVNFA